MNGRFILSFLQPFENDIYLKSFLEELEDSGLSYSMLEEGPVRFPEIEIPFNKE